MRDAPEIHRSGEFSVTCEGPGRYFLWRDTATARAHCGTFDFHEDPKLARELAIDACDRRARTTS